MMPGLYSGLSALQAAQATMDTVAHNLANANTPEYHRQVVDLRDRMPVWRGKLAFGTGVQVEQIRRLQDTIVQQQLVDGSSQLAANRALLEAAEDLEGRITSGPQTLQFQMQHFFDQLTVLSSRPNDLALHRSVVDAAQRVASEFSRIAVEIDQLQQGLDSQILETVAQANRLARDIASFNQQIRVAEAQGLNPNDLLDRRDQLIQRLSELVDVRLNPVENVALAAGGQWLIASRTPDALQVTTDADGQVVLKLAGSDDTFLPAGGQLAGLMAARDPQIAEYRQQLDQLLAHWIRQVDGQYSAGIEAGTQGFELLHGSRGAESSTVPLAQLPLVPPVEAGAVYLGVTDLSSGERTLTRIDVDPAAQALDDIAAAISAVANIQAFVQPQAKVLSLLAADGYRFDFTGRPSTQPDLTSVSGTTVPQVGGVFTGDSNRELVFVALGSGEIGVTEGLEVGVKDLDGNTLQILKVGKGYAADSPIDLGDGMRVRFSAGTFVAGDTFDVLQVAEPDTAGLLPALGINSLFTGTQPYTLSVQAHLRQSPGRLATTLTGESGQTQNLQRMITRRDLLLPGLDQTLEQLANHIVASPGYDVRQLQDDQSQLESIQAFVQARHDSLSGVDPNEELVRLIQFQRHFQAGAQVLRTVHDTTADLLGMLR